MSLRLLFFRMHLANPSSHHLHVLVLIWTNAKDHIRSEGQWTAAFSDVFEISAPWDLLVMMYLFALTPLVARNRKNCFYFGVFMGGNKRFFEGFFSWQMRGLLEAEGARSRSAIAAFFCIKQCAHSWLCCTCSMWMRSLLVVGEIVPPSLMNDPSCM